MEYDKLWSKLSHQVSSLSNRFNDLYFERRRRLGVSEVLLGILKLKCGAHESYRSIFSDWADPPAGSSFSEARSKVPASFLGEVRDELLETWNTHSVETHEWNGFNVFAIDGSKINLPRKLVKEGFAVSKHCYYPQGLLSILFNVTDRTIHGLDFSNDKSERQGAKRLCENLGNGNLIIFDKGYYSFGLLCELIDQGLDLVFAMQGGTTDKNMSEFRSSKLTDTIIDIDPTKDSYRRAKSNYPDANLTSRKLRLIKYKHADKEEILATTLFDEKITAAEIAGLYHYRWRIEELYKAFKITLEAESFHAKTANGVEQEIQAISILWNLSRKISAFVPDADFKKNLLAA